MARNSEIKRKNKFNMTENKKAIELIEMFDQVTEYLLTKR